MAPPIVTYFLPASHFNGPYPGVMDFDVLEIDSSRRQIVDLTERVRKFCAAHEDGLCNVFVPHATAGVAIIETGAGPTTTSSTPSERLLPRDDRYSHAHGSPGHGADTCCPRLVAPSVTVPGRAVNRRWERAECRAARPEGKPRRSVRLSS